MLRLNLTKSMFSQEENELISSDEFSVVAFKYPSGIEALKIANSLGHLIILPYFGQMIWDAEFNGINLRMHNFFDEPKNVSNIIDTYGCFAFHSGLLANGCPAEDDTHIMHGELACAKAKCAYLELSNERIKLSSEFSYMQGFGHKYLATASVVLDAASSLFEISMQVRNLSGLKMPLMYMCHINYAYFKGAKITSNIPASEFKIRQSVPSHIHPTQQWYEYTKYLQTAPASDEFVLDDESLYDPEIVFMADDLSRICDWAEFDYVCDEANFYMGFSTRQFSHATRWLLYNHDQKVCAFALPATCRPEGFNAASKAGSLRYLEPNSSASFRIITGIKSN